MEGLLPGGLPSVLVPVPDVYRTRRRFLSLLCLYQVALLRSIPPHFWHSHQCFFIVRRSVGGGVSSYAAFLRDGAKGSTGMWT